jgi:hypothetical protein
LKTFIRLYLVHGYYKREEEELGGVGGNKEIRKKEEGKNRNHMIISRY